MTQFNFPNLVRLAQLIKKDITFYDLETTGFVNASNFAVVELALLNISQDGKVEAKASLINPLIPIPKSASDIHHITDDMVKSSPVFAKFIPYLQNLFQKNLVIGYNNIEFDNPGVCKEFTAHFNQEVSLESLFPETVDVRTLYMMDTQCSQGLKGKLEAVVGHYQLQINGTAHRAAYDVHMTASVMEKILELQGIDFALQAEARMGSKLYLNYYNKQNKPKSQPYQTTNNPYLGSNQNNPPNVNVPSELKASDKVVLDVILQQQGFIPLKEIVEKTKMNEVSISFSIGNLLRSHYGQIVDKISIGNVQSFLELHLQHVCNLVWTEQNTKQLKPLFEYFKQNNPEIVVDYTQLRIGLKKIDEKNLVKNKIKPYT